LPSKKQHTPLCRSELAREEPSNNAFFQSARVIVHAHREQARSYRIYRGI
jgi:hypothetical protein